MTAPVPRRLRPDARREQLLDAALTLAAGRDLALLSVREIASAAGVSEGLLYHYFPNKDALVLAAVQRAADAMTSALDSAAVEPGIAGLLGALAPGDSVVLLTLALSCSGSAGRCRWSEAARCSRPRCRCRCVPAGKATPTCSSDLPVPRAGSGPGWCWPWPASLR